MAPDITHAAFEDARQYRKTALIRAVRVDHSFTVQSKEGALTGQPGDYLAFGADDTPERPHRWIISAQDFAATYEPVEDDSHA
jgi:hypothetical protein